MKMQERCMGQTIEIAVLSEMKEVKAYVITARSSGRAEVANSKVKALNMISSRAAWQGEPQAV